MTTEIKRRGEAEQTYTFKVSSGDEKKKVEKRKKCEKAKEKEKSVGARFVEIEEPDHGGIVLRQVGIFFFFLMNLLIQLIDFNVVNLNVNASSS